MPLDIRPMGDAALVVAFGDAISPETQGLVRAFCDRLARRPIDGVLEWVPAYANVTVFYDPCVVKFRPLCDALNARASRLTPKTLTKPRIVEIPVVYGGEFGPDLDFVAESHSLTPAEVISLHCASPFPVYFLGFLPGFAYLGGLPEILHTPRHATPRLSVPAGSVGIGGAQTGIYPCESPGGWQIIGRTNVKLFDATWEKPSLLTPGDAVQFVDITGKK